MQAKKRLIMLLFVGLGLYSWDDISVKGLTAIKSAESVFIETYTSCLMGSPPEELERAFGTRIHILSREEVEQHPDDLLELATRSQVVFLTGGDPMVSTTHTDLRLRAAERGIPTAIIHGASIASAVCGLTGLQNYRFGKSCSVPYPSGLWFPTTPMETVTLNQSLHLHTLVYLDISEGRYMTVNEGIAILETMAGKTGHPVPSLVIGIARAGSSEPKVVAGPPSLLTRVDFGPPLHILVIPANLHPMEEEYLHQFAEHVP